MCYQKKKEKRHYISHHIKIFANNGKDERVESFTYVGVKLFYNGNVLYSVKAVLYQALVAYHHFIILNCYP